MYHVGVDVGGTFTDLFAVSKDSGDVITTKVETTRDGVTGVVDAISKSGIEAGLIQTLIFGSTRATNALVEGKVAPVAFFATEGFSDTLEIRRLWREHLFGWHWDRPEALVSGDLRFGIPGRIDWRGQEIEPLDLTAVDGAIEVVRQRGVGAIAVSLLFSFLNAMHEVQVRDRIKKQDPAMAVVLSSDVNPQIKDYERGSTTALTAALSPLVNDMLSHLDSKLTEIGVCVAPQVIKSNGGIMSTASARAKPLEIIRSGPAGGVASVARLSSELGIPNLIGIDIGGTTADVCVITDGAVTYTEESYLQWDIPIRVHMADVRSVGSGGGSIAHLDAAERLHVGPQSSGSDPGPACYGRGGKEPTTTDAAVIAGLVDPQRFLGGDMSLDVAAAREAIRTRVADPLGLSIEAAAGGIFKLATARMAQLIGEMTVQVGLDPRDYVVVGFGGAGPMFAATLTEEIEAAYSVVPRFPAVWSAFGGLFADIVHDYAQTLFGRAATVDLSKLNDVANGLMETARLDLERDHVSIENAEFRYAFDLRYSGQSHQLSVLIDALPPFTTDHLREAEQRFEELHENTYAHRRPEDPRELTTVRLQARVPRRLTAPRTVILSQRDATVSERQRMVFFHGFDKALATAIFDRDALPEGYKISGPAIIEEDQSTTVVPPGATLTVDERGNLMIRGQMS